jgi:DNA-binding transcriptional LysR family regulator
VELTEAGAAVLARARHDSSGASAEEVAAGRLELALGFATGPVEDVIREPLRDERAVLAVAAGHPLADRAQVSFRELPWETAVRTEGCVGRTTRSAAPSTARGVRLLELRPEAAFQLELIEPARPDAARRPVARAFARLTRELTR